MRYLILVVALLAALVIAVAIVGAMLPREHTAVRSIELNQPPQAVWEAITDHANEATWRGDIAKVERQADKNGNPLWKETYKDGEELTMETRESVPPKRLVRVIAEEGPFSGQWEFNIVPLENNRSRVTLTERGAVGNPIFRFVSRFVIGHYTYMEKYLTALAGKFGEKPAFAAR